MENLINTNVIIDYTITSDPYKKAGQIGVVKSIEMHDEENADCTILFKDGVVGIYQLGTFNIFEDV